MARDPQTREKLRTDIKAYFNKLDEIREYGVKKYTTAYCLAATADKFYLLPGTIQKYIYSKTY